MYREILLNDLPNIPETYVHRIGRTGRAGSRGIAIYFCMFDEIPYLKDIEQLIGKRVPVVKEHPYPLMMKLLGFVGTFVYIWLYLEIERLK